MERVAPCHFDAVSPMKSIGRFIEKTRTVFGIQSLSDCVRTRTRKAWSRNTETKPNFYWLHSWWWFRAQMSALQQATAFLGATNRDATTIPPVLIRRNTSTLNDTLDRKSTRLNSSHMSIS